jgi:hypothetical protein
MTAAGWLWAFAAIHAVYGALQGYASGIGAEARPQRVVGEGRDPEPARSC